MAMTHDEFTASAKKFCDEFNARLAATQDRNEIEALRKTFRRHMDEVRGLPAALAEGAMQRLTDVQQEMEATINETRHHRANRMLKEAMDSDRENIIRNMPDFDFSTESKKRKPLTEDEIDKAWRSVDYTISYDNFRIEVARAIERAHGIGSEE